MCNSVFIFTAQFATESRRYVRAKFVILDPAQLENHLITVFHYFREKLHA
jgi:hypothetical protein